MKKGHNLPVRYIIHTVGPVYCGTDEDFDVYKKYLKNFMQNQ